MKTKMLPAIVMLILTVTGTTAIGGPLDPDCTPEKAAKSAAMKATVGVGGRCSPAEAAKDTAKRATGMDEKGEGEGLAKKAIKQVDK